MLAFVPFLALSAAIAPVHNPARDAALERASAIVADMTLPGMDINPVLVTCGEVNALYLPEQIGALPAHTLVLCNELVDQYPEAVPVVIAHEMSHAIIDQLNIPITGSDEDAADEFAAVYLGNTGNQVEMLAGALFYQRLGKDESHDVGDTHASLPQRAYNLMCMEDGSEDSPVLAQCQGRFQQATRNWGRLIVMAVEGKL